MWLRLAKWQNEDVICQFYWQNEDVKFNWKANLTGAGSRSLSLT